VKYLYSVVKFVPDPVRGEFINVGAIVGSDETCEWQLRMTGITKRARSLDDKRLLPLVLTFGDSIGRTLDDFTDAIETGRQASVEISEEWLVRLYEDSRNVIQLSPPAPIAAGDVEAAMAIIFDQFIVESQGATRMYDNKTAALSAMRKAYIARGLSKGQDFKERAMVKGAVHSERFDFSVLNGRVVQLVQAWSFQNPDQDAHAKNVKAWAWTVEDLRSHGGHVIVPDAKRYIQVARDVTIEALYVPPLQENQESVFEEALNAFGKINVRAVSMAEVDEIGVEAIRLLEAAKDGTT
jgi:hypothetical protein